MEKINGLETEGEWKDHIKVGHSPRELNKKVVCCACDHKFDVTLNQNLEKKEILIYLGVEEKEVKFWFWSDTYKRENREQVTKYSSVCPNCGFITELFCAPENPPKIISGKWWTGVVDTGWAF